MINKITNLIIIGSVIIVVCCILKQNVINSNKEKETIKYCESVCSYININYECAESCYKWRMK